MFCTSKSSSISHSNLRIVQIISKIRFAGYRIKQFFLHYPADFSCLPVKNGEVRKKLLRARTKARRRE